MIKKALIFSGFVLLGMASVCAQDLSVGKVPYRQMPEYPENYSAASVAARMVDGLGFRFYWATDGLRDEDLKFQPNEEARTTAETIDHIYALVVILRNAIMQESNGLDEGLTFAQKRLQILHHLEAVSNQLRNSTDEDLEAYAMKFGNGVEYPFWNLINGPIADAVWHCGQIASFRRSSGNPFNGKVDLLSGKVKGTP